MWVTRPATQRSLSVINNSTTYLGHHHREARRTHANSRQWSSGNDSSHISHHSYGRRVSPAFLPSVSSITGATPSNLSTLTYTSSSTSRSPCSNPATTTTETSSNITGNTNAATALPPAAALTSSSARRPIRTTRIAYEPSVSLSSTHHSSSAASYSSHKSTWAQRINRALERLFPSNSSSHSDISPSSPPPSSQPSSQSLPPPPPSSHRLPSNIRRGNSNSTGSHTSDLQFVRFSRGREASLKQEASPKLASIMESEAIDSAAKESSIGQLKSVLKSSKSVFIVASLCILCGSTIFSVSYPFAKSVPETADSVQLIGLMFVGMGIIIFILAVLFTLCSYHHSSSGHRLDRDSKTDTA